MLQKELDEELKNMKQREIDLKNQLIFQYGGDTCATTKTQSRTVKEAPVEQKLVIEGARKQQRAMEILKTQMAQQRLRTVE